MGTVVTLEMDERIPAQVELFKELVLETLKTTNLEPKKAKMLNNVIKKVKNVNVSSPKGLNRLELLENLGSAIIKDDNESAIFAAMLLEDVRMTKWLIEIGTDIEFNDNLLICCASEKGKTKIVKILIEAGVDVTVNDNTPINMAVLGGYIKIVEMLIKAGADVTPKIIRKAELWTRYNRTKIINVLKQQIK